MKITSTINHRCGHTEVITVWCDGRSRKDRERAEREAASLERAAASDDCCACYHRRARALAGGDWADATIRPAVIRAVLRVARLTGGRISRSPLSASLYVTWPTGAWRVSDHPWPGEPGSLVRERGAVRGGHVICFARLQPNWLELDRDQLALLRELVERACRHHDDGVSTVGSWHDADDIYWPRESGFASATGLAPEQRGVCQRLGWRLRDAMKERML